ncbi:MAG: hypothetical protein IJA02_04815 [Clostridia bacterium]|nr:hypothetical protein [Clostridia bacterium]
MLKSVVHILKNSKPANKQQEIANVRAAIEKIYKDFIDGEGKLPQSFSERYNKVLPDGYIIQETPFEPYLKNISNTVDRLTNKSGISDWIYLNESADINTASAEICDWVKCHREMNDLLSKMCRVGDTLIMLPLTLTTYCERKIMIVTDDRSRFDNILEESLQNCKSAGISFCLILSDCELYDLVEQKAKKITYVTYPNYHDEIYADWSFE